MAVEIPTGVVTLLFSDIQGSTELFERLGDRFHLILEQHNAIFRKTLVQWNGYEVKTEGDAFMISFSKVSDAVLCAIDLQQKLAERSWPQEVGEILVRIGLHTGEPILGTGTDDRPDYFGTVVNRAARIVAAGHGGQILVSSATHSLAHASLPPEVELIHLGAHRLKGLERPEDIFQVSHPDLPERIFQPLKTLDRLIQNLPVQLTPFIGRERELREVRDLLKNPQIRLLTLVGPGGTGKTRLALQAAAEVVEQFPDGVWFVELAEARQPEEALSAITSALRLSLGPDHDSKRQLLTFLADQRLLLVLDNSEQLSNAGPLVTEILREATRVECLVTSRSILRVRGENLYEVQPFPTPPVSGPALPLQEVARLAQYDSIALFIERARAVNQQWRLTEENAPAVAELCRRLEGIPLTVELAAARISGMTVQDILRRLDDRFRLLSARVGDIPGRQRTLRATLDWSYDLLSEKEKQFFARISVFVGGFRADAAEHITDNPEALDLVLDLKDKSLLSAREAGDTMRYLMLDAVREYAAMKLEESTDQAQGLRRRHLGCFLRFAEDRLKRERTPEEGPALEQMAEELDNLRAAVHWAKEHDNGSCARLSVALCSFLTRRGFWDEALVRARVGETAAEASGDLEHRARTTLSLASVCTDRCDLATAREGAAEGLRLARDCGSTDLEAAALNLLGIIAYAEDSDAEAETFLTQCLGMRRRQCHQIGEAMALHNLGRLAQKQGEAEKAASLCAQALVLRRQIGDRRGIAGTLYAWQEG